VVEEEEEEEEEEEVVVVVVVVLAVVVVVLLVLVLLLVLLLIVSASLFAVSYGHFFVEHVHGHHKMVALDEDPATARYGEPFYSFVPRVLKGEFTSACRLEAARLKKSGLGWYIRIPAVNSVSSLCC